MLNALNAIGLTNTLLIAGAVLLLLAIILVVLSITSMVAGSRRRPHSALRIQPGLGRRLFDLILAVAFLFFALSVLLAGAWLSTYSAFTRQELAGTLECLTWEPEQKLMVVRFSEIKQGKQGPAQTYTLYGDQWEVNAHILSWSPQATMLGLHTAFRLHMLKGIYQEPGDESQRQHQAYSLSPGKDWLWPVIWRYSRYLPFVKAVYGNAVSLPPDPGELYDIFVTTSGLSTQRREP